MAAGGAAPGKLARNRSPARRTLSENEDQSKQERGQEAEAAGGGSKTQDAKDAEFLQPRVLRQAWAPPPHAPRRRALPRSRARDARVFRGEARRTSGETPVSPSKRARPAEEGGMQLRFARLSEHATAPTRGSARAAGYDLYSAYDYTIPPMEKALVKTDIQIALPSGCYGRVAPRSGLAAKHFIDVGAGVIDEDYRGNVGVVLFNFGKEKFEVKKGDRIAQLICERIFYPEIEEVQALDDTERGSGGFGSTGKN
ncbi:deoxyuridine 5'-triphosphate nucleotidohydrolase, mitochondrial isoform X3 [Saimiri boliviensis]|uniref:deoxyuridine 5'-triphosphate nucleotidohydrolase, mitochondrial isoform X3 n=1 Tax=Saimiri boliviensis TaxID=27679 RepID=UPI00193D56B2|nr:deoxyuridine 5'-triphosphate nucleotidohydrolase, mitochondrial isoform X2 [Saimiri boliviensis boliviensis]